ncbi:hypothetical protein K438DRAFT_1512179, partial [Mycena galopus ATCC 62051]
DAYRSQIYVPSWSGWLAQANAIFNSLDITFNLEEYSELSLHRNWRLFMDGIRCYLELLGPMHNLPPGYLFLCSLANFETEVPTCVRISEFPAYWSLDPSGAERLNTERARNFGFPDIELRTEALGMSWDLSVYPGIRHFHEAKGFDPYSQDVAIALKAPPRQV